MVLVTTSSSSTDFDVLDRTARQYRVRAVGVDLGRAVVFQGLGRVAQGTGGIDHVVYQMQVRPSTSPMMCITSE